MNISWHIYKFTIFCVIFFSIAIGLTLVKMIYNFNYVPDIRNVGSYIQGAGKVAVKTVDVMKHYGVNSTDVILPKNSINEVQENEEYQIKQDQLEANKTDSTEQIISKLPVHTDLKDLEKIVRSLYVFESSVSVNAQDMKLNELSSKSLKVNVNDEKPKILIFHTHSQETFIDSKVGKEEDSIIGVGNKLAEVLYKKYKIRAIHDKGKYDVVNGKLKRDGSYTRASEKIQKLLKSNPQIEIVIDIHRDGIPDNLKLVTEVNKKRTAKLMFVNGICEKITNGKMEKINNLANNFISENMSFSLQMQLQANEIYPNLMRKILIKPYRYSLFMKPKSLLVEVGAQNNTLEEAKNAMEPFADMLAKVIK
ncbi:MAG TPA: stage II sporulation protein P [Clostridiales bacterium]|nr:MAG: hypothetical protein A2Y18_07340 [Clostridiales bacterium GWD2_32_19]HCC08172.1 stage II sporulation protein P [Clostridiales bacterium]